MKVSNTSLLNKSLLNKSLLIKALTTLVAGSLVSIGAQAANTHPHGYNFDNGRGYLGLKAGTMMVDVDDADDLVTYGIYGGYNFNQNVGVELDYVDTSDESIKSTTNVDGEYNAKSYGIYGTYRYYLPNNRFFVKGKVGFAQTEFDVDYVNGVSRSSDDSGVAGGVGLGYRMAPNVILEAEYDVVDSDADMFTIGAHYQF